MHSLLLVGKAEDCESCLLFTDFDNTQFSDVNRYELQTTHKHTDLTSACMMLINSYKPQGWPEGKILPVVIHSSHFNLLSLILQACLHVHTYLQYTDTLIIN